MIVKVMVVAMGENLLAMAGVYMLSWLCNLQSQAITSLPMQLNFIFSKLSTDCSVWTYLLNDADVAQSSSCCRVAFRCPKLLLSCRDGYPPERGYSGAASYGEAGYGERSTYGSGYGGGGYDRGYDDRAYPPRDVYSNRGAAPARETAYSRPGPERDYGRPAARAAGPYDRSAGGLPPR